ncbi:MAG: response regulator [Candidatus Nanopelagicales bacterium]
MRSPEQQLAPVPAVPRMALPYRILLAVVSIAAAAAAEAVSVASDGAWRLEVVALAVVIRESRSWLLRGAAATAVVVTAVVMDGVSVAAVCTALIGIALAAAVVLVLARTLAPTPHQLSFGRRFAASIGAVLVAALVAGLLQTAVHGWPHDFAAWRSALVTLMLPLVTAAFVAAGLVARHSLVLGGSGAGGRLTGPFAAIAVTVVAMQLVTGYWARDEQQALDTAARTVAASFQQVLADDLTSLAARTSTPPTAPLAGRDEAAFTRYATPLVEGSPSVVAAALAVPGAADPAPFAIGESDGATAAVRKAAADPASTGVITAATMAGVPLLVGLTDSVGPDGGQVPLAVYVAPIKNADGSGTTELLMTAVSLPQAFAESTTAIGALREQVSSDLVLLSSPAGSTPSLVTVDAAGAAPESVRSQLAGSSQAGVGDYMFDVVVRPGPNFGPSILARIAILLTMLVIGAFAAALQLQSVASRERSRRDAAEREALLAAALNAAPGQVLIVDSRGKVLICNGPPGTSSSLVGRPAIDTLPFVLHGEPGDRVRRLLERARYGEAGVVEYTDPDAEQGIATWLVEVSPVGSDVAGNARAVVQVKDLTEERARAVRSAQTERLRSLGTMAGGLAHDFNNLLFIISGYLQMLRDDDLVADQPRLTRYVDRAADAAERGAEIASSLLAVARSQPLEATAIEVGSFVQRLAPLVRQAVGSERLVRFEIGEGPLDVLVDSGQLSGSLLNLVINSRDAMEPGGTVIVRVAREHVDDPELELPPQDYVVIEVVDDGIGMTSEVQQRAFEPYFTTKGVGDGTGIGLAAVYSFAQQSGGIAVIESEHGLGTTVRVLLPAVFADHTAPETVVPGAGEGVSRVLVVDDEAALAGLIAGWLTEHGAEVRVADNPAQAVRVAADFEPDLLLTDVRLGDPLGVDGPELADRITELVPGVEVVFMTGFSDRMDELMDRGAHTLSKPFTKEALVRVLFPVQAAADDAGAGRG